MRGSDLLKLLQGWAWVLSWMVATVKSILWSDFLRARLLLCAVWVDSSEVRCAYLWCDLCDVGLHVGGAVFVACLNSGGFLEESAAPILGSTRKQLHRIRLEKSMRAKVCPRVTYRDAAGVFVPFVL